MKKTGFVYDERYLLHDTGPWHPETADRLRAIYTGIAGAGLLPLLMRVPAREVDPKWVRLVHPPEYIERFRMACLSGKKTFDSPDNQMCAETYNVARLAVGGILEAVREVMAGEIDNAFCAVRPPGHHAESDKAMGFCYFNNVAVAARYLQIEWNIRRVGIVDFDVHHGNGTQRIFERDAGVFYYSIHQHPSFAYPGTGREFEQGTDEGVGYTKNSPMLPGQGDRHYKKQLKHALFPAFERFQPEVILVSTGFDAHIEDEMSDIKLSTEAFSWIMKKITDMADAYCAGRLISILEGGYALAQLGELAKNHIQILLNR